ncbi:MAG: transposase [Thaumarchaeota archaeon]|nr:transposase [Nitrososphaerota archaeon]
MSKRRSPQDKADVVVEFFTTHISAAELCRKHNVSPATFQDWKDKFLQGGRQALASHGNADRNRVREVENLKRIIAEVTIANDVLKKTLEGAKR